MQFATQRGTRDTLDDAVVGNRDDIRRERIAVHAQARGALSVVCTVLSPTWFRRKRRKLGWIPQAILWFWAWSQSVSGQLAPVVDSSVAKGANIATRGVAQPALSPQRASFVGDQAARGPGMAKGIDTVVVCASHLQPALRDWLEYRRKQGHRFAHVDGEQSAREIRHDIRRIATAQPLKYVLILGDADPNMVVDPRLRRQCVPTFYAEAKVNTEWGSEPHIATDNPYADLTDDHLPELAVARICFDSQAELQRILQKSIDYETAPSEGLWHRRVHFTAGIGGFGTLADTAIEVATKKLITEMLPPEYATTLTHGSWKSAYCPDPRMFRETVLRRFESGGLFWVYMGHGYPDRLDRLAFGETVVPILEAPDVTHLQSHNGLPIAILLACYTGAYDQESDCLAERLVRLPRGPVAAIAGSRVTMPYGMAVFGTALMQGYFKHGLNRAGDVFLHAKRALGEDAYSQGGHRKLLDAAAIALSPGRDDLPAERLEHQLLFQLLGDPLLRIPRAAELPIECPREADSGSALSISGNAPEAGKCLVELVCRRDRLTFTPPRRLKFQDDPNAMASMMATYARANDRRWTGQRFDVSAGRFSVSLSIPEYAEGPGYVRVFLQGKQAYYMASSPLYVQQPRPSDNLRTSNAQR